MKTELICASLLFSAMVFTPCLTFVPSTEDAPLPPAEEIIYEDSKIIINRIKENQKKFNDLLEKMENYL